MQSRKKSNDNRISFRVDEKAFRRFRRRACLLSFSRRHLEKLVGLPGSLGGSLADVVEETPRVFNCFFLARGVEEGVAAEDIFSLDERAVGDRDLAAGSFVHADACGAKAHALDCLTKCGSSFESTMKIIC